MSREHHIYALLKFFSNETYLNELLSGKFYCNSPEFYRNHDAVGVGDRNESCASSFRISRDSNTPKLSINGIDVEGLQTLTIHNNQIKDKWMHCWFAIAKPETDDDFAGLIQDINRMRKEFGNNYAVLDGVHIQKVVDALKSSSDKDVVHGHIGYSSNKNEWSAICKSLDYEYQREYRFLIGNCHHLETNNLDLNIPENISKYIGKNLPLRMNDANTGEILFELTPQHFKSLND
ncbi:MAG: hypothetical protein COA74_05415 [Gammaproteobacteria bacterium]|nr:MAG: hypothetical protein COA74_05415 [Gammaproteobacteria bacterium]